MEQQATTASGAAATAGKKARIRLINRAEIFKPIRRDSREKEHFVRLEDFMTGMNANVFRENPLVTALLCPTSFP